MAKTLHITVADKIATYRQRDGVIVCGNSDYTIDFTFDAEWDDHPVKTARFITGGTYTDVVFEGTTVLVPVITNTTSVSVGVFAGDLTTTTPAIIECQKSILCDGGIPAEPPPEFYGQIIDIIEKGGASTTKIVPFSLFPMAGGTYVCQTSVPFAEIYQAHQDGATIVATSGITPNSTSPCYRLDTITETAASFVRSYYKDNKIVVDTITLGSNQAALFSTNSVEVGDGTAGAKVIEINLGYDPSQGVTYSCSPTTFVDITNAAASGQVVIARVKAGSIAQSAIYYLTDLTSTAAAFAILSYSAEEIGATVFTISNTNTVTKSTHTIASGGGSGDYYTKEEIDEALGSYITDIDVLVGGDE